MKKIIYFNSKTGTKNIFLLLEASKHSAFSLTVFRPLQNDSRQSRSLVIKLDVNFRPALH